MHSEIEAFPQQFSYEPKVECPDQLGQYGRFLVLGMGGSHLAADLLRAWQPELPLTVHSDYGLPSFALSELRKGRPASGISADTIVIASSYSGNTEETLDGFKLAREQGLPLAAISIGGKLLELARDWRMPYVQLPDTGIQPRLATGLQLRALLALMGRQDLALELTSLTHQLKPTVLEPEARTLATALSGHIPVVYGSTRNFPLAYYWKITLNETAKSPAFANVFPESNHNELSGFDIQPGTSSLAQPFQLIFLIDPTDHPQIQKRMNVLARLYQERDIPVTMQALGGSSLPHKIFSSVLLAILTAHELAARYKVEPDAVPLNDELKRLIAE